MNSLFYSSAKWQEIRDEAIRYYVECARCGSTDKLTVHHKNYENFGGNELIEDLEALCSSCHKLHHETEEIYWVRIINKIEKLKEGLKSDNALIFTEPKSKEKLKLEIKTLKRILEDRKNIQGMSFIVIHNCHICTNSQETSTLKYKCKSKENYGCVPGEIYF